MGRAREYCTLIFLSSALLVRILYATVISVTIKRLLFLFLLSFLLLQYRHDRFSILIDLISLVTTQFSCRIRNTVLQLSPVISSVFKI